MILEMDKEAAVLKKGKKKNMLTRKNHHENQDKIFLKMFAVLLFLCIIYIPIIHSLSNGVESNALMSFLH